MMTKVVFGVILVSNFGFVSLFPTETPGTFAITLTGMPRIGPPGEDIPPGGIPGGGITGNPGNAGGTTGVDVTCGLSSIASPR